MRKNKPAAAIDPVDNHGAKPPRRRVQTKPVGESKTKQAFADQTNINTIMARYNATGQLPVNTKQINYLANSALTFQEAQQLIATGKSEFAKLSPEVRNHFENDPGKMLEFLQDEQNREKAIELGLVEPKPAIPRSTESPTPPSDESQEKQEESPTDDSGDSNQT